MLFLKFSAIQSVKVQNRALDVIFEDGTSIIFEDCWLRDNCRCSSCYHAGTSQRAYNLLDIPDVNITSAQCDKSVITVTWSDKHESVYSAEFLVNHDYKTWRSNRLQKPIYWHGDEVANKVAKVHVDTFLNSVEGAKEVFTSLLRYGLAFIEAVDASMEATEKVCIALGGVQHTYLGGMWQFNNSMDHGDLSYTNMPLTVHNDNTCFTEAAGLQVLHCLVPSGSGGETVLVDGFYGASQLKKEFPEDFEFLTNFDEEAQYKEDGYNFIHNAPVIQVNEFNDLKQVRFNTYDRAPMAFTSREECRAYYRSLKNLTRYYVSPEFQWKFKLVPGQVMVMDNFRVLHGRTAYSGRRVLCGSYIARSEWMSKARTLELMHH